MRIVKGRSRRTSIRDGEVEDAGAPVHSGMTIRQVHKATVIPKSYRKTVKDVINTSRNWHIHCS
ncbi:hypothetical protein [Methylobacterium sp. P5_C11]